MYTLSQSFAALCLLSASAPAQSTTAPATNRVEFPSVTIDRVARQVRVECQSLAVEAPLEFYCVANGGPEHESVLRTAAKPSHIHAGLLMLGMQPGSPVTYIESKNAWTAPYGPTVKISVEWKDADGKLIHRPADALLAASGLSKEKSPPMRWIFAGSHQREDGTYLADLTGYVVTLCNFEHSLIDVPRLVGSANETLEWQPAADGPKRGTPVTMILEPVGDPSAATQPGTTQPPEMSGLTPEQARVEQDIAALRTDWRAAMQPHEDALRDAAKAHDAFIAELREKQKKQPDEAGRIDTLIEELNRAYAEMTAAKP